MAWTSLAMISIITLTFLQIDHSLSMVIAPLSTTKPSVHLLRLLTRNSLIETSVNDKQLFVIENQLRQKRIPYRRIPTDSDGFIIIIGPFQQPTTSATKQLTLKSDSSNITNERVPSDENRLNGDYTRTSDRESYDFRHCLEACEVFEGEELKPDHDCIRNKCLDDITGI